MYSSRKRVPTPSRRYVFAATLLVGLLCANSARAQSFPYEARIVLPGAPVRSGPGDEFYITDTLAEGQTIEVYRHRPNGWCAIRPTDGSFSWVYGPHIHLLDDSLGEVDKPDVASRIGSRLSRQRNAVQVRLKKGEVVQVLEVANEGGQKWYKIAPPAGEFRWIHRSCISSDESGEQRRTPVGGVSDAEPNANQNNVVHESTSSASETPPTNQITNPIVTLAATEEVPASTTTSSTAPSPQPLTGTDWRAAPLPPPLATTSPASTPAATNPFQAAARPAAEPAKTENPFAAANAAPAAVAPAAAAPATPAAQNITVADDLSRDLTEVELRLSRMITEPPATWQIAPLQNEAEQLLTRARTVTERDAVKLTLEKVDRFAAIQRRHQQLASAPQPGSTATAAAAPPQPQTPSTTPTADTAGGQFDAVGVLRPVVSKRPGAPQFALVDQRGQVVSFVSATPDLNLQPFVGHRIGIAGNRGFIPEFHRAHVTAGRVTPLDQTLTR